MTIVLLVFNSSSAQKLVQAYEKGGAVMAKLQDGKIRNIANGKDVHLIGYSTSKNLVIYEKLEQRSKAAKGDEGHDQYSIRCFYIATNTEKLLFTTCLDFEGGTKPLYAGSKNYPFDYLCGFDTGMIAKDGELLYFQTDGWTVSPAVHCYNLIDNKLTFFRDGWLTKATKEGVEIQVTGIEYDKKGESKGRYVQKQLYDFKGKLIKNLSEKEF